MRNDQFITRLKGTMIPLYFLFVYATAHSNNLFSQSTAVKPGSWSTAEYIPMLAGKNIALVANQTSTIGNTHLVDTLLSASVKLKIIFAPEHGFRGDAANGEKIKDGKDAKTGLPVKSLYGSKIKPDSADLAGIDYVVFDIQDVGVRFYTYLTTLHYVMEACADYNIPLLLLDRPNPNGHYIDGPILESKYKSMVGVHPIPLVHGMTLGELALMINGEGWLASKNTCNLTVIKTKNWDHNTEYKLPIPPSPNLPSQESIILYPTMGLFEGTVLSMGRGTDHPFVSFGAPWFTVGSYKFTPREIPGKATNPPFEDQECRGFLVDDFARNYLVDYRKLYIEWFELLMSACPDKNAFFNSFFDKLAGTASLRQQILTGVSSENIRKSWQPGLENFKKSRSKYMLYPFDENIGLRYY